MSTVSPDANGSKVEILRVVVVQNMRLYRIFCICGFRAMLRAA